MTRASRSLLVAAIVSLIPLGADAGLALSGRCHMGTCASYSLDDWDIVGSNPKGSLMKLMHDPEFPEDAKELGKIMKRQPWKIINHPTN